VLESTDNESKQWTNDLNDEFTRSEASGKRTTGKEHWFWIKMRTQSETLLAAPIHQEERMANCTRKC
jgi:hypothetical protein